MKLMLRLNAPHKNIRLQKLYRYIIRDCNYLNLLFISFKILIFYTTQILMDYDRSFVFICQEFQESCLCCNLLS